MIVGSNSRLAFDLLCFSVGRPAYSYVRRIKELNIQSAPYCASYAIIEAPFVGKVKEIHRG